MKCVIFLLALYIFDIVFADDQFEKNLKNLRKKSLKQMDNIVALLHWQVEFAIIDAVNNGLNRGVVNVCYNDFTRLEEYHKSRNHLYAHCYWKADLDTDYKFAELCYAENIQLLEEEEKKCRADAKACIAKHYAEYFRAGEGQHPSILL